jgi:hypothetical protein
MAQVVSKQRRRNDIPGQLRAFALLKEQASGWLAHPPPFIRAMTADQLRLMADCYDDVPGAMERFELVALTVEKKRAVIWREIVAAREAKAETLRKFNLDASALSAAETEKALGLLAQVGRSKKAAAADLQAFIAAHPYAVITTH